MSGRLLDAAEHAGELVGDTAAGGVHGSVRTPIEALGQADQHWGSVTTAMPRSHEYVIAAGELHVALTETSCDGLRARDVN